MSRSPRLFFFSIGIALACVAAYLVTQSLKKPNQTGPESPVTQADPTSAQASSDGQRDGDILQENRLVDAPVTIATDSTRKQSIADSDLLSPEKDGWKSEHYAELAGKQLKSLLGSIANDESKPKLGGAAFADSMRLPDFRPDDLSEIFRDPTIVVRKHDSPHELPVHAASEIDLKNKLRAAVPFEQLDDYHAHVKIVSVNIGPDGTVSTDALIELSNSDSHRSWQSNAKWTCEWKATSAKTLTLSAIQLLAYKESEFTSNSNSTASDSGKWFTDQTHLVAGHNQAFERQLKHGHHYWLQRIERSHRFDTSVRNGLAIGDANGDGLDDVYVCQPPGLPNLLLIHQSDGTASNQAATAGVNWLDQTSAAIFADLDNDGDQDLTIGTPTETLVMSNDGKGNFSLATTLPHDYDVQSLSVVDYDGDGLLDVFVCLYRTATPSANRHFLYRDAVGGGQNRLFKSTLHNGELSFTDVTESAGLTDGGDRYTLAASWEDFDNDGDQDLYVANDFGKNYLYRNDDGHFTNIAPEAGVEDIGSGMSVGWGDYDRDGWMDLYVGNMFSSAGNRVTTQPGFRTEEDHETREIYRRLAKGNSLFKNRRDGTFAEVGADAGVELGRWAWSSLFADLNNDGWEDLLVANGYITTPDSGDL